MTQKIIITWAVVILACSLACKPDDEGDAHRALPNESTAPIDDSGDDTADTQISEHSCPDVPWATVEVGYNVACGIHVDGCVECWGRDSWRSSMFYDEPDLAAVEISLRSAWGDDHTNAHPPFACIKDVFGSWTCWGYSPTGAVGLQLVGANQVAVGDEFVAILYDDGSLVLQGQDSPAVEVSDVTGELSAGFRSACAVQADDLVCWTWFVADAAQTIGPAMDWSQYSIDDFSLIGVRSDGSVAVVFVTPGEVEECTAAGSNWTSARGISCGVVYVQDSEGYVYRLADEVSAPLFPVPVASFDFNGEDYPPAAATGHGACGVTQDGLMVCTTTFSDYYPPPGAYVLR